MALPTAPPARGVIGKLWARQKHPKSMAAAPGHHQHTPGAHRARRAGCALGDDNTNTAQTALNYCCRGQNSSARLSADLHLQGCADRTAPAPHGSPGHLSQHRWELEGMELLPAGNAPEVSLPVLSAQGGKAATIPKTSVTLNLLCSPDSQDVGWSLLPAHTPGFCYVVPSLDQKHQPSPNPIFRGRQK